MESSAPERIIDMHHYRLSKDQSSYDDLAMRSNSIGVDSGYASSGNVTVCSDISSSIISNHTGYRSCLEPINEDVELTSFHMTPISKNAQMIDAFHITTPENDRLSTSSSLSSSPIKFTDFNRRYCEYTPTKLQTLRKNIYTTPSKNSSRKRRRESPHCKLSRENSFDLQYNEDIENASFVDKIPLSPLNYSKTNTSILLENHRQFERKLSENTLQSSTPINFNQTAAKLNATIAGLPKIKFSPRNNLFRKTQSFSPSKYLQEQYENQSKTNENVVLQLPNPAKHLLNFSSKMFDKLVHEKIIQKSDTFLENQRPLQIPFSRIKELNESDSSKIIFSSGSNDLANKCVLIDNQLKLLPTCLSFDQVCEKQITNTHETTDIKKNTANTSINMHQHVIETDQLPTINKSKRKHVEPTAIISNKHSFAVPTNYLEKTPKRIRRSASLNIDPIKEKNIILYSHLPCTPPKNRRRLIKRQASVISGRKTEASSAKRKLYETTIADKVPLKRFSYDGFKRLDILRHLADTRPAIELILRYLTDRDLANVYAVSRHWARIVTLHSRANNRRKKFIRQQLNNIENVSDMWLNTGEPILMSTDNCEEKNRKPFSMRNGMITRKMSLDDNIIQRSPLLTPSKRRFYEEQKIIEKVDKDTKFRKCPRCSRTSIIQRQSTGRAPKLIKLRATKSVDADLFPFKKQNRFSFDIDCDTSIITSTTPTITTTTTTTTTTTSTTSTNNYSNHYYLQSSHTINKCREYLENDVSIDKSADCQELFDNVGESGGDYAICTGANCCFKFCLKCLCNYTSDHFCMIISSDINRPKDLWQMDSPISATIPKTTTTTTALERNMGAVSCTKRSKRNLRRLCSIDKN